MNHRCEFWLPTKRRSCANIPLPHSKFCGNHNPTAEEQRVPCSIDPSHSVLAGSLESHLKRCPMRKRTMELEEQPFYQKGVNAGEDGTTPFVTSEEKRNDIYKMSVDEFRRLVVKIKNIHSSITLSNKITDSYVEMDVCGDWAKNRQQERKLPFQEKHSLQQASILGNMEIFGILKQKVDHLESEFPISENGMHSTPAVVEFGAGRGYLTQMLVDCYGIYKVFLVERRAYKLKADRSLRKNKSIKILQRLRIDIEDLNLDAINQLRGLPYLAIGKHICGPATDLTLRCCFHGSCHQNENAYPKGLALAMCCHHLCQWKHYIKLGYNSKNSQGGIRSF